MTSPTPTRRPITTGIVTILVAALLSARSAPAQSTEGQAPPGWQQAKPETIRRWQDMRFGMFIHWGP